MTEIKMDWQIHKSSLSARFKELYRLNQWTDCTFSVGEENIKVIRAHKLVLVVSSPVFEALLYGPIADTSGTIRVPDVEPHIFTLLLDYIYTDSVELHNIRDAGELLYAAKKYILPHLSVICLNYVTNNTNPKTVWDSLAIAEGLHEEDLLKTCIKVLVKLPLDFWLTCGEHISGATLARLLEEPQARLSEPQLWKLALTWAEGECEMLKIPPVSSNKRTLLNKTGILSKIRFLTFSEKEFLDFVGSTDILSSEEATALQKLIKQIYNSNINELNKKELNLPSEFNSTINRRIRLLSPFPNRCSRQVISKHKLYTYGGEAKCEITCDCNVHVLGFEVFTRIATISDYMMGHGYAVQYKEQIVATVKDREGNVLSRSINTPAIEVPFDSYHAIFLSVPVWFSPNRTYTVTFELSSGQYPLSFLSQTAGASPCFTFRDITNIPDVYQNIDYCGILHSVLYDTYL